MTHPANITISRAHNPKPGFLINRDIVRRSGVVALVIGSILTLANQYEAVVGPKDIQILSMALVYLTPFVVVALSQTLGIRQAILNSDKTTESILKTAISHGIPARAALVGLIAGILNSAISGAGALIQYGNLDTVSLALSAQAFSLPIIFGMLSQAIAYRRATASGV